MTSSSSAPAGMDWARASLGRSIALAVIEGGRAREGQTVHISMPDRTVPASVTGTVFYDPENKRLSA